MLTNNVHKTSPTESSSSFRLFELEHLTKHPYRIFDAFVILTHLIGITMMGLNGKEFQTALDDNTSRIQDLRVMALILNPRSSGYVLESGPRLQSIDLKLLFFISRPQSSLYHRSQAHGLTMLRPMPQISGASLGSRNLGYSSWRSKGGYP